MGLVDELRQRGAGSPINSGGGFSGGNESLGFGVGDIVPLIGQIRDRNLSDFQKKSEYMNDLSLRRQRAQAMIDPETGFDKSPWAVKQPDVVFKDNHPDITPLQQEDIGVRKQGVGLQTAELKNKLQDTKFKQDLETKQLALDTKKNDQIYATKQADMERKQLEADAKLKIASERLDMNKNNAENIRLFHEAQMAATQARHETALAQKDRQMEEQQRMNDARIADLEGKRENAKGKTVTTELNPEETKRTTKTVSGAPQSSTGRVKIIGPNGPGTVSQEEFDSFKGKLPEGWSLPGSEDK